MKANTMPKGVYTKLKSRLNLTFLMGALLFVSCAGGDEETQEDIYVHDPIPASFIDLAHGGMKGNTFTLTTNAPDGIITVTTTDTEMITNLTPSRGTMGTDGFSTWTIGFDVTVNTTTSPRSAKISVIIGGFEKTVSVSQNTPTYTTDGLANCYMVVPGGKISIPITRAITIGEMSPTATATVEILWDDAGIISARPTLSGSGDTRTITVQTSSTQGNAVIALQSNRLIYWSWHIWVVNYDPNTGGTWSNNGYTFMDRNLGATEATLSLASWGLLYQWGRKDPFPTGKAGTAGYAALSHFKGMSDAGVGLSESTIYDAILESIQHPITFYSDWHPHNDTELWNTYGGSKTEYDPCPAGWRVPVLKNTDESSSPWWGLSNSSWIANGDIAGIAFGSNGSWPYQWDTPNGGSWIERGRCIPIWTANWKSTWDGVATSLWLYEDGTQGVKNTYKSASAGCPVRCSKE
jgi:hypothetical protein